MKEQLNDILDAAMNLLINLLTGGVVALLIIILFAFLRSWV